LSPKETLLTPNDVSTPGVRLDRRIPSRVSTALVENSGPGCQGERQGIKNQVARAQSIFPCGNLVQTVGNFNLAAGVRAIPCSSIVRQILRRILSGKPKHRSARSRPPSGGWNSTGTDLGGFQCSFMTSGSVESMTKEPNPGARVLIRRVISSASLGRSVSATHRSSPWAAIIYLLAGNGQAESKSSSQDHLLESGASGGVQSLADQEMDGVLEHINCLDCGCQPWNIQPGVPGWACRADVPPAAEGVPGWCRNTHHHGNMILFHKFRQ
jgi:hypothetical protein